MASKGRWYQGQWWPDPRGTRAWRKLKATVVVEEPLCWLRLPGCTRRSTVADHVIPIEQRPDLGMSRANLRGACAHCNGQKSNKNADEVVAGARWTL